MVGLFLFRRVAPTRRLQDAATVSEQVFTLAGVLYAVLVAFVVVVVWEQFDIAQTATESEATAISDLLRDSVALPPPPVLWCNRASFPTPKMLWMTSFRG